MILVWTQSKTLHVQDVLELLTPGPDPVGSSLGGSIATYQYGRDYEGVDPPGAGLSISAIIEAVTVLTSWVESMSIVSTEGSWEVVAGVMAVSVWST
jgi:hypothetical protein